jgi:hypothetical protein
MLPMKLLLSVLLLLPPAALAAQDKPRLYLTDRDAWKEAGWVVAANGNATGGMGGRVVREHTENVRTFNNACPGVTVTENKEKADFALIWDRTNWNETAWNGNQNNMALSIATVISYGLGHRTR